MRVDRLDRDRVLRAALRLVDRDGLAALTMRRLAADLGVGVMTLYGYVRTKADLLDGITQVALEPLAAQPPAEGRWDEQLATAIRTLYAVFQAHPGATQILADGVTPGPALDPVRESLLAVLRAAGFDRREAVVFLHTVFSYVLGFAVVAGHRPGPSPKERKRVASLPRADFPHLADSADEFSERFSPDSFEAGLELILTGLRAERRTRTSRAGSPKDRRSGR